ncbi:MAG: NB-ARC domain-containing protein [Cyanobacteria bacterium P01_F01_bin.150]
MIKYCQTSMPISAKRSEDEFSEAAKSWDLDALYLDLADAKGKGLTRVEKQYLRGLLCYCSPNEIAERLHVAGDTVRNYLSKGLYRYIEAVLINKDSEVQRVKDWSRVPPLLEAVGYRLTVGVMGAGDDAAIALSSAMSTNASASPNTSRAEPVLLSSQPQTVSQNLAKLWQGAPDASVFYGRTQDLETLHRWIGADQCRMVSLVGIGGIGKTTLAAKLTEQLQEHFDVLVWRSLRNPGPIEGFLRNVLGILDPTDSVSPGEAGNDSTAGLIQRLMTCLHRQRCLLVWEDVQFILQSQELAGQYQPGFEAYGTLFKRIGEESHSSCLIVTGWEKPKEVAMLEGQNRPVQSMKVKGLGQDARFILEEKGLSEPKLWNDLIMAYRGNPFALKIIATTIQDLFGGSVDEFLSEGTFYLGDFTFLLYKQFERLSSLERGIMTALAKHGDPMSVSGLRHALQENVDKKVATSDTLKALESLGRRSLIEKVSTEKGTKFTLQPMMVKYVLRQGQS